MIRMRHTAGVCSVVVAAAVLAGGGLGATQSAGALEPRVDQVFARYTSATPGCAVGVGVAGTAVLQKAYGMADLEHDVRNTPETIFEAGSVSKQFTAAAVLLLAREGKLSLDDPVRRHVPELPDYGAPLTIRHMLMHMSGLRDWGAVAAIGGWPRTSRVYTHAHVLDIISRQKVLNFPPGDRYSYSNSGYNLAAMIVTRVSGHPFARFSEERLFTPLGMTHTSWRDDFTRVVKGRAIAYQDQRGPISQNMPFENVHGNGGLLTTVGDLLRWNENFVTPVVGDAEFLRIQQEPGAFNSGKPGTYALGLQVGRYKGVREVGHSGSTAGYRAHLARYPDQHVSVAVLCNASSAAATQFAHAIADLYLGPAIQGPADDNPGPRREPPAPTFKPSAAELAGFAGTYTSDEAETVFTLDVEQDLLVLKRRPDTRITLRPTAADTFSAGGLGTIRFHRAGGAVTQLAVSQDRVFDLRFERVRAAPTTTR
jgi:CubicO group peptidase (beta-lactamase class C family)